MPVFFGVDGVWWSVAAAELLGVLELLDHCGDEVLMEHPTALLVLMRRRYHYA